MLIITSDGEVLKSNSSLTGRSVIAFFAEPDDKTGELLEMIPSRIEPPKSVRQMMNAFDMLCGYLQRFSSKFPHREYCGWIPKSSIVVNDKDLLCTIMTFLNLRMVYKAKEKNRDANIEPNPCRICKHGKNPECVSFQSERINRVAHELGLKFCEGGAVVATDMNAIRFDQADFDTKDTNLSKNPDSL